MRRARLIPVVVALCATGATAQTMPVASLRVERSAAESCPDEGALRAEVDRRLGRSSFAPEAPLAVVVRYRPASRGLRRASVTVREGSSAESHRELAQEGPGCEALTEAVELAIALLIDPDAALRPPTPPPPPGAATCPEVPVAQCPECAACPSPPVAPPVVPAVAPAVAPARRALPSPWVALTGGVVVGVVPAPALSLGLTVMVPFAQRWSLDLGASFVPAVTTRDGNAGVGRTVARAGVCLDTAASVTQFGGCAGVLAGVLQLSALALEPVAPGDRAWVGAAAEAHVRLLPSDRWVISVQARAVAPLLTWAPRVEGASAPSFAPPPVAFEADVAVGVRLP